ncbi:MAG: MATE family efflux transporter [Lachnospiraceae bacterium]|nr:MATE family efflux transporter [Lachnospiraceae bacterium]
MKNDYIVKKLYVSFVMLSILSALTATAGMLIDNIIIGHFFGTVELGAMGVIGPVSSVFSAVGNICSGGGTTRAAQAIGTGEMKQVHAIFTITTGFAVVMGAILSIVGLLFAPQIAGFLGATGELMQPTIEYLQGFFLGAVPTILLTMLSGFVKIDGSPKLPLLCIVVMTVSNIILDLLMVLVFRQGMFGMALATSISYCVAVFVCCTHFLKKSNTLRLIKPEKVVYELIEMLITGAPTAMSRICDVIKITVLNRMLSVWVGVGAVAVLNIRLQAHNFFGSLIMGFAMASVPIVGMFFGEEDRTALRDTLKSTLRIGIISSCVVAVILFVVAPGFAGMLGITEGDNLIMAVTAIRLFSVGMPLILVNMAMMSYYQGTKNSKMASLITVLESLVFTLVFTFVMIKPLRENGVWIALLFAEIMTLVTIFVCTSMHKRKLIICLDDIMRLPSEFGGNQENRLELSIGNSMEEVMKIANGIYQFGYERQIPKKTIYLLSLCIEEMAGNIVQHVFERGEKRWFDLMVLDKEDSLVVRIRDNGKAFDPTKFLWDSDKNKEQHYGIRMILGLADSVEYRRTIGLNNILIKIRK